MKKLIAGVGLTVLAIPTAQAWTGSMDEMRTMQANESKPIVRVVKRYQTVTLSCGQCQVSHGRAQRHSHQATGWQRSARVTPQRMQRPHRVARAPVRPVQMYAYYVPQRHAVAQHPPRIHRIVGQAPPMCRYIR